jgi:hypothetical protein
LAQLEFQEADLALLWVAMGIHQLNLTLLLLHLEELGHGSAHGANQFMTGMEKCFSM